MYEKIENLLDKFYKTYYKIEEINLNQVIKCLTTSELHIIEAIGENKITMNDCLTNWALQWEQLQSP